MSDVVNLFTRRRKASGDRPSTAPTHRREGHFDEQDVWHDDESEPTASVAD